MAPIAKQWNWIDTVSNDTQLGVEQKKNVNSSRLICSFDGIFVVVDTIGDFYFCAEHFPCF